MQNLLAAMLYQSGDASRALHVTGKTTRNSCDGAVSRQRRLLQLADWLCRDRVGPSHSAPLPLPSTALGQQERPSSSRQI
jgi:hypothetical protein